MESVKKLLDVLFIVTMVAFLILAAVMVFGQIASLFVMNGALTALMESTFLEIACMICSITGLLAYVMSYLYKWKMGD